MNRDDYEKAAEILDKHYTSVLNDFTERIIASEDEEYSAYSSFGSSKDDMIHEFARKLESIIVCGDNLRHIIRQLDIAQNGEKYIPQQVDRVECTEGDIRGSLEKWIQDNPKSFISSINIFKDKNYKETGGMICIILYQDDVPTSCNG